MGGFCSCCCPQDSLVTKEEVKSETTPVPVYSWDKRANLDPADYCFDNVSGEVRYKSPGSINGQQFSIDNCEDSTLLVLDHVASITIDDCKNCKIVVGSCKGSVFIRDSTNVKLAIACQQFRSRDCKKCDVYLHCNTQPIIEFSVDMKFACLQLHYESLSDHADKAGISLFNNEWSNIYDFSPVEHGSNFSLLDKDATFEGYFKPDELPEDVKFDRRSSVFPFMVGNVHVSSDCGLLVIFLGKHGTTEEVLSIIREIETKRCSLRRSKVVRMNTDTVKRIFESSKQCDNMIKHAKEGKVIGFEIEGPISELIYNLPKVSHTSSILLHLSNEDRSSFEVSKFFNYVDMVMST